VVSQELEANEESIVKALHTVCGSLFSRADRRKRALLSLEAVDKSSLGLVASIKRSAKVLSRERFSKKALPFLDSNSSQAIDL
jgi:hypothetical protein